MREGWKQRTARFLHGLLAVGLGLFQSGRGHTRQRWVRATDLEALARRLHDFERQLGRARGHYARKHLSRQEMELVCRRTVDEVQTLLQPLHPTVAGPGASWALERLREVLHRWQEQSAAVAAQPLQQADVSDLQARLLEITTALYLCARVDDRDGGW
ncbi:hypothetical protein [Azohydromonas caseinilytica]|uniref:Uncharacterized protein n=1 Tax=Azohydromonas caseinilytica TaxID=2728836 RepID=A0A848FG60_9BURK|nr:hypothetical protein [Azohydromonas caseinilytica]NML17835.1 hypothetical protein [Azohydromonas caseinilytica]